MNTHPSESTPATPKKKRSIGKIIRQIFKVMLFVLGGLIVIGTFVFLYQKSRPEVQTYELLKAERRNLSRTTIVTGTIEPRDEVLIKPQISGIIAELHKQAGDVVRSGDVIAKIKVIPDMGQLSSAEARVRLAQLNLQQQETDFGRMQQLYEERLVSAEEFEKAQLAYQQAREEKASATEALQIVRDGVAAGNANFSTTLVRSTIDGLVLDVPVKVGNSVIMSNTFNDGTTVASVADMSRLIFKGSIDETEVARLHEGMKMKVSIGALTGHDFAATLEYISPKVSTTAGQANQFEIKGALALPSGVNIRAGYSANAEIVLEERSNVLSVPEGAIEFVGDSAFVHVLTSPMPQTFTRRAVKTGLSDGMHIEILSGLKGGEQVRGNLITHQP